MEQKAVQENPNKYSDKQMLLLFEIIMVFLSVAGSILIGMRLKQEWIWIGKSCFAVSFAAILFIQVLKFMCEKKMEETNCTNIKQWNIYSSSILFLAVHLYSLGVIYLSAFHNLYGLWMLGGWVLGISVNHYFGACYEIFLCISYCMLYGKDIEEFFFLFVIAIGCCLLAPYLRKVSTIGYVVLIVLLCNGMLLIIQTDFQWKSIVSLNSLGWECSVVFCLLLATLLAWTYTRRIHTGSFSFIRLEIKEFFSEEESSWEPGEYIKIGDLEQQAGKENVVLEQIIKEEYPLWRELKKRFPLKAAHMKRVAEFSKKAALEIEADALLAYAGGLYHEIGRLQQGEYVSQGVLLGMEHAFPAELISVIEEHNVNYKLPVSKEATIVMLADGIASMLEKAGVKKVAYNEGEFIKKFFQMRITNGNMKESEMTFREYARLCDWFCKFVQQMNKEEGNR